MKPSQFTRALMLRKSKMDGQRKKRSLHDYFSSQSKKTKSSKKESNQGKGEPRSLSNIITKLTEAFCVTDKSHLNTMANYCRAFRGLEKEVFIKIYFTLLTRLCPFHSKDTKGRKILLYHTHIPLNNLIFITSQKKMFFLVQDRKSFFNCFFRIAEENI